MSDSEQGKHVYPSSRYAWYMVIMLTIAYIFSFVDRYILGLLIEPIKADLQLSDTQIGLLLGPAFAIFYVTIGLPLGWLRAHRIAGEVVFQRKDRIEAERLRQIAHRQMVAHDSGVRPALLLQHVERDAYFHRFTPYTLALTGA